MVHLDPGPIIRPSCGSPGITPHPGPGEARTDYGLAGLGLLILALCVAVVELGDLRAQVPQFLWLYGAMFALYLGAVVRVSRVNNAPSRRVGLILLIGTLCRVTLLTGEPTLSDDIYRYLWDGRVQRAGINPYQYPPNHPALAALRDDRYPGINHRDLETIYPPLAQVVFRTAAALSPTLWTLKGLIVLFDLATAGLLCLLLAQRRGNPALGVIYAWNPLVMLEYAHSGHVDSVAVFLLVLGVWLVDRRQWAGSVAALAGSGLAKYFSALLLPYFLFKTPHRRWVPLYFALVAAGYAAFLDAPGAWWTSLGIYARHWEFNSPTFGILTQLIGDPGIVRGLLLGALAAFSAYHGYRQSDFARYAYLVVGFALLFTPTVHPWYVCWIIPFLCLTPNRGWIAFSGLVSLSYWVWVDAGHGLPWSVRPAILWVEYAPLYGLLAWEARRGIRDTFGLRRPAGNADTRVIKTSSPAHHSITRSE